MPISDIINGETASDSRTKLNAVIAAVNALGTAAGNDTGDFATAAQGTDARTPTAHAASHTNGTDDIQDATAAQKGLATAAQITKLDGIEALADVTDAANVAAAGAVMTGGALGTPSSGNGSNITNLNASNLSSGTVAADRMPALTGDVTTSAGFVATTLATVNSNVGSFGSATAAPAITVNAKGLVTAASANTITPAVGSITGLGTGVATALAVNVGSAGSPITNGGALGTPSSGTLTNATGLPVAGIVGSTSTALGVGSLEIGNASDTTLARSSAGNLTVEGNLLYRAGGSFVGMPVDMGYACSDETTALTTGEKVVFYAPFAFNLTSVECCVTTAPTGSAITVDVEKPAGTSLLSAVASISASAFTATGSVSGGTQSIAKGDRVSIDIDQIGSTIAGTGLKVTLIGTRA